MRTTWLACALALALTPAARAQFVVVDPTNLVQNIITAAQSLEQVYNQIRQIQQQAQMLINMAKHLENLDFSTLYELRQALARTNALIEQAQGLAYEVSELDTMFERLYPEEFTAALSADELAAQAHARWRNVLEGLRTTMQMQAQAARNMAVDERALASLVGYSQSAQGQLEATQAGNQLLGLVARQTIQSQQLRLTQDRMVAAEQGRDVAEEALSLELRRRFRGDGVRYTPHPVDFYGD
jgi:P-type conjugative transfer protein TrbJ